MLSIFYPIERIVGQQTENLIFNFGNYIHSLGFIVIKFFKFGLMPEIIFITLLILYFLIKDKYLIDKEILFFLIFFIVPIFIYFFVGYAGLQYPRYFIFPIIHY